MKRAIFYFTKGAFSKVLQGIALKNCLGASSQTPSLLPLPSHFIVRTSSNLYSLAISWWLCATLATMRLWSLSDAMVAQALHGMILGVETIIGSSRRNIKDHAQSDAGVQELQGKNISIVQMPYSAD